MKNVYRYISASLCLCLFGCASAADPVKPTDTPDVIPDMTAEPVPEDIELLSTMADPYSAATEIIAHRVPLVYEYLQQFLLVPGDETKYEPGELGMNDQVCYGTEFGYMDGDTLVPVRKLALSDDQKTLYEYHYLYENWYERPVRKEEISEERLREDLLYQGFTVGFAYLGEGKIEAPLDMIYGWAEDLETVDAGGTDLFLIVPRDRNASAAVNTLDLDGNVTEVLYRSESGEAFLLKAGDSHTFGGTEVVIVSEDGKTLSFEPYHMPYCDIYGAKDQMFAANLGIADYIWTVEDDEAIKAVILEQFPDLEDLLKKGMVMEGGRHDTLELNGHPCWQILFGTNHDGMFTREKTYAVSDDLAHVYEYNVAEDAWYEYIH